MSEEHGAIEGHDKVDALVVGAGPAGLMAADTLAATGRRVVVADAMPSIGRKFLMAGKSGLNLTKSEPLDRFVAAFDPIPPQMEAALRAFGPDEVTAWAEALGTEVFVGSTGRVFPKAMKASPLLRAWSAQLGAHGVELRTRWRWTGWDEAACVFETSACPVRVSSETTVFALGGASWSRLGSTGAWAEPFRNAGVPVAPFRPANVGFRVAWSDHMKPHFGAPVKQSRLIAGEMAGRGEWVVSERGIEGGGIYEISQPLRDGASLHVDLLPDLSLETIARRLAKSRNKSSLANHLRKTLGLSPVSRALLMEWGRPLPTEPEALAQRIKSLPARIDGPLPMDGAISTAGGVAWSALSGFELRARPGTWVAGEMLDWEAPTGGYLITGCLATGRAAALQAIARG